LIIYGPPGYHRSVTQPRPRIPMSQQIAADIRAKITAGEYKPEVALPSIVALAAEYQVATGTIQKALRILKAEGVVESVPSYGTFPAKGASQ
jgi:GntR family transcriptional regulator